MCCILPRMLETVEGRCVLCAICCMLEVMLYALEMLEGKGCAPCVARMVEAAEGGLCLLKVLEVIRCVLLCKLGTVERVSFVSSFEISIVASFWLQSTFGLR